MFNAYIGIKRYDIIIDIGTELLERIPNQCEPILRNLAVAYRHLDRYEEETQMILRLITDYPMSDINHYRFAAYYLRKKNYIQAYYQFELAAALDLDDIDYMFAIAGVIIDRKIARTAGSVKSNLSREEAINLAVPFIYQSFEIAHNPATIQRCQDFLLRNRLRVQADDFICWIQSKMVPPELNFDAIDHIKAMSANLQEEYCKQIEIL